MISSPGWAGRQCSTIASSRALGQQLVVDPVGGEERAAALGVVLVAHAHPHVGVDGMRVAHRLGRLDVAATSGSDSSGGVATATSTPAMRPATISDRATLLPSPT